ncbi:phytanoyl-CoA dioxygenase family protein (plasmid) [Novosphingobium sp. BL-8A]|uniref:phytanoyl-CoA dioxygenase family protein n=1 Tax=Novosphingobium sp. BL-8A TaxID=3127639 RepID=UPI0037569969
MTYPLDRRTRRDSDRRFIGISDFFTSEFPRLNEQNGTVVRAGIIQYGAAALTIEVEGQVWTLRLEDGNLKAFSGADEHALRISLTADQFSDLAQNQMSLNGFLVARSLRFSGRGLDQVSIWDSLWIGLLEGWPSSGDLSFLDEAGNPLDLQRSFGPDEPAHEIAHFLRETGYVHLAGWLDPADMAQISNEIDCALPHYTEGDGKSWWASTADGKRHCVRLQEFIEHSPTTHRIMTSPRWALLREVLAGSDRLLEVPIEGRVIEALIKPVGVIAGPSDLTYHRDCHLGRHAYVCSRMTVGISLSASGPENGQLRVVAGSHRVALPVEVAKNRPPFPVVSLRTAPGDLTVHLSCTLHEATPPVIAERRVMYTEMPLRPFEGGPGIDTSVGELRAQIDDIHRHKTRAANDT